MESPESPPPVDQQSLKCERTYTDSDEVSPIIPAESYESYITSSSLTPPSPKERQPESSDIGCVPSIAESDQCDEKREVINCSDPSLMEVDIAVDSHPDDASVSQEANSFSPDPMPKDDVDKPIQIPQSLSQNEGDSEQSEICQNLDSCENVSGNEDVTSESEETGGMIDSKSVEFQTEICFLTDQPRIEVLPYEIMPVSDNEQAGTMDCVPEEPNDENAVSSSREGTSSLSQGTTESCVEPDSALASALTAESDIPSPSENIDCIDLVEQVENTEQLVVQGARSCDEQSLQSDAPYTDCAISAEGADSDCKSSGEVVDKAECIDSNKILPDDEPSADILNPHPLDDTEPCSILTSVAENGAQNATPESSPPHCPSSDDIVEQTNISEDAVNSSSAGSNSIVNTEEEQPTESCEIADALSTANQCMDDSICKETIGNSPPLLEKKIKERKKFSFDNLLARVNSGNSSVHIISIPSSDNDTNTFTSPPSQSRRKIFKQKSPAALVNASTLSGNGDDTASEDDVDISMDELNVNDDGDDVTAECEDQAMEVDDGECTQNAVIFKPVRSMLGKSSGSGSSKKCQRSNSPRIAPVIEHMLDSASDITDFCDIASKFFDSDDTKKDNDMEDEEGYIEEVRQTESSEEEDAESILQQSPPDDALLDQPAPESSTVPEVPEQPPRTVQTIPSIPSTSAKTTEPQSGNSRLFHLQGNPPQLTAAPQIGAASGNATHPNPAPAPAAVPVNPTVQVSFINSSRPSYMNLS